MIAGIQDEIPNPTSDLKTELDIADCMVDGEADPNVIADYENGFTPLVMLLAEKDLFTNPAYEEKINRVIEFFISRGAGLFAIDKVKEKIEQRLSKFSRKTILQALLDNSINVSNHPIETSSRKLKITHESEERTQCGCFTFCK